MSGPSGRFWRSVMVVLGGTAAAQAIPLLGSLLLARLFAPAEFGLFATWLGAVSVAAVVLTGRFEMALAIEAEGLPRRIAVLATLATIGLLGAPLLLGVVAIVLGGVVPPAQRALWLAGALAAAAIAAAQTWQAWSAAEGRFRDLSTIRIAQAAAITGAQIAVGLLFPSALALALAHLAGVALGLLVAARRLPLADASLPPAPALRAAMRGFVSRQRRFPLVSLPADSINTAAAQLPLLIVASRFGAEVAGWLALTMRTLGAPIALLGASVLDVFRRQSAASWREKGHCREDFMRTLRVLAPGAAAFALPLAWLSEELFAFAFGERWRMSGTIALWLLPMFALRFVASPLSYMFYVAGKQHVDLAWQVGLLGMTLATLWLPAGHAAALQLYSAGYAVLYLVYLGMSYRFSLGARA